MSMSDLTFELPFHPMCSRHQGLFYQAGVSYPDFIDFDQAGLSQCPNVIIKNGVRFVYKGIAEGQAVYVVED